MRIKKFKISIDFEFTKEDIDFIRNDLIQSMTDEYNIDDEELFILEEDDVIIEIIKNLIGISISKKSVTKPFKKYIKDMDTYTQISGNLENLIFKA